MADETSQNEITKRLAELPEDVRELILSPESGQRIRAIGQRHNLHVDQLGNLENETMFVMLGFFEPENFSAQLQQQLLIPAEEASLIAKEVSDEIFTPIRESLKKFTETKRAATEVPTTPAPAETPVKITIAAATPTIPVISTPITPIVSVPAPAPTLPPVVTPAMPAAPMPPATPIAPAAPVVPPPMPHAEQILTEKTVVKPIYKADPYREPIE